MTLLRRTAPLALLSAILVATAAARGKAESVAGAGATFPAPLYARWAEAFTAETGIEVTYQGVGSGEGVKRIEAGTVAFGGSDRPLGAADLQRNDLLQFATLVGGILPVVNLPGYDPGVIVLDGPTLRAVMTGSISRWNAPEIARLNPKLSLPALPIQVLHRSDSSGSTAVLVDYLGRFGAATAGGLAGAGVAGSTGMVEALRATPGAIGYIDYADAKRAALSYADMVNGENRVVQPTPSTFATASANADWSGRRGVPSLVDAPGAASWPITTATFVLLRGGFRDRAATATAARFLDWGLEKGSSIVEDLDYVPLPASQAEGEHRVLHELTQQH